MSRELSKRCVTGRDWVRRTCEVAKIVFVRCSRQVEDESSYVKYSVRSDHCALYGIEVFSLVFSLKKQVTRFYDLSMEREASDQLTNVL